MPVCASSQTGGMSFYLTLAATLSLSHCHCHCCCTCMLSNAMRTQVHGSRHGTVFGGLDCASQSSADGPCCTAHPSDGAIAMGSGGTCGIFNFHGIEQWFPMGKHDGPDQLRESVLCSAPHIGLQVRRSMVQAAPINQRDSSASSRREYQVAAVGTTNWIQNVCRIIIIWITLLRMAQWRLCLLDHCSQAARPPANLQLLLCTEAEW